MTRDLCTGLTLREYLEKHGDRYFNFSIGKGVWTGRHLLCHMENDMRARYSRFDGWLQAVTHLVRGDLYVDVGSGCGLDDTGISPLGWDGIGDDPEEEGLDLSRRVAIAQTVIKHWQDAAARPLGGPLLDAVPWDLMKHALALVGSALQGETDPRELGVEEGPDAERIRGLAKGGA